MPPKKPTATATATATVASKLAKASAKDLPVVAVRRSAPAKETKALAAVKPKSKPNDLTPEEKVAQQALVVSEEAAKHVTSLSALTVISAETEMAAIAFRKEVITAGIKQASAILDPMVQAAKASYDVARGQRDKALRPFEDADRKLLDALSGYATLKNRLWREEQEKAEREQAEMERLAAIQRKEEERKAQAEIDRQLEELADKYFPNDPPEELVQKITGVIEQYQAPMVFAPPVQVSQPESFGMTQQPNWKGRVLEGKEMDVLLLVIEGDLPMSIIEFKEPELNRLAKLYQDKKKFEGLVFENKPFVRGTGR